MRSARDWHRRYQQQANWTRPARQFLAKQLNFANAHRMLDVGCGTGALFPDLERTTFAKIVGLDIDLESLQLAKDSNTQVVGLTCGDAFYLPYLENCFDIVLCHYLLLWLPNPIAALAEMVRTTRKGGYVCILAEPDYGGRIDYPPAFERIGQLQMESLRDQGADAAIGRKLPALLAQTGLVNPQVTLIGGHWSGPPDFDGWSSEWHVLEEDLRERLPAAELHALRQQDASAWERGERLLYVPTFYAWGRK
jgi:SAM-dependent methyltransferase